MILCPCCRLMFETLVEDLERRSYITFIDPEHIRQGQAPVREKVRVYLHAYSIA
jgi:hypothetical protein